ncbi:MAG: RmuC family, partial [Solirubrobacterales bacterium]|nr:RmuC family [Solirubrobacterales bacterium]
MTALILIAMLAAVALAAFFAVRASKLGIELSQARSERDNAVADCGDLSTRLEQLPELQRELATASARLEEIEAERDRLLGKDGERAEKTSEHITRLRSDLDSIKVELPKILDHSSKAASGAERVESSMSTWTRRIANPQSRGAFGELAVENQLKSLGLEPGRDYMRQVAGDDGRLRPDFVVRLGDAS